MPSKILTEKIALLFALIASAVLGVAAWGKFFYPIELLKILDRVVSGFEVLFIIFVICFRKYWQMWALASTIFAAWSGYAFYWYSLELPCSCMGKMLEIPSFFSIGLDVFFWMMSLLLMFFLRGAFRLLWVCSMVVMGPLSAWIGYVFAHWVYNTMVKA